MVVKSYGQVNGTEVDSNSGRGRDRTGKYTQRKNVSEVFLLGWFVVHEERRNRD